jgi:monoamine oxidase
MPGEDISDRLDVAIVGGGVSGLYAAWRLLTVAREQKKTQKITIYEMGERVGGRLLTWLPAGANGGLRAELGGMRFLEQQEVVWNLLPALGFTEAKDFVPFWVEGENLRLMLRGVSTSQANAAEAEKRYLLATDEKGKGVVGLLEKVIEAVLGTPENIAVLKKHLGGRQPTTRKQWDEVKPYLTWKGLPLWNVGFWNLLSELLTSEAYQFISDAFGYYSLATNWNAAEAIQTLQLDFSGNAVYKTLREGMSAIPEALAREVVALGGKIVLNTRLVSFEAPVGGPATATLKGAGEPFTVQARALLLGLPRRSLQLLAPSRSFDLAGDQGLTQLFNSALPTPAFKLFLFFDERWWEKLGITKGRSICDLPLRQTYYFAPEPSQVGGAVPKWGLLMASYDDERAVDYWQGLVPPEDQWPQGRAELRQALIELTRRVGVAGAEEAVVPEPPPHLHMATDLMVAHAREQLALLHDVPVSAIPKKAVGAFADWSFDPFGGGWNFWQPQVNVKEAMERVKQPLGGGHPAFVIGEAYSGVQGWVEGALTATEVVLQKHLGLPWPTKWLPTGVYLGW